MKSIKGKVVLITICIVLFSILPISTITLVKAKSGITQLSNDIYNQTVEVQMQNTKNCLKEYINVMENGEEAELPNTSITNINDPNCIVAIFDINKTKNNSLFELLRTNMIKEDNKTVTNSFINKGTLPYEYLIHGNSFTGVEKMFSQQYYMKYEPIMYKNEIVGAVSVGIKMDKQEKYINGLFNNMFTWILAVTFIVLICSSAVSYHYGNSIGKYFNSLSTFSNKLSIGKFTTTFEHKYLNKNDELANVGKSVNKIKFNLSTMIYYIQHTAWQINDYFTQLNNSIKEITEVSNELSCIIVNRDNDESNNDKINDALENFKILISDIESQYEVTKKFDDNINKINEEVNKGKEMSNEFQQVLEGDMDDLQTITNKFNKTANNANNISKFSSKIKDIANQTNILSLNASSEASRNGSKGNGFAIIACEMKKCAENIKILSQEMDSTIGTLNDDVGDVLNSLNKANDTIIIQSEYVKKNKNVYSNIQKMVFESMQLKKE